MELQTVEELAITSEDLGVAIAEEVIRKPKTRGKFIAPSETEARRELVVRRNVFFLHPQTEIQGQPFERLVFVLNINGLVEIASPADLSETLKHASTDRVRIGNRLTVLKCCAGKRLTHMVDAIVAVAKEDGRLVLGLKIIEDRHMLVTAFKLMSSTGREQKGCIAFIIRTDRNVL